MKSFRRIHRYLESNFRAIKQSGETLYLNTENNVVAIKERNIIIMRFINDDSNTVSYKNHGITVCICKRMQFPVKSNVYCADLAFCFDTRTAQRRVIGGGTTDIAPIGYFNSNDETLRTFDNTFSISGLKRSSSNGIVGDSTIFLFYFASSKPFLIKNITANQAKKNLERMEKENDDEIEELENRNVIPHYWREQLSSFYNSLYEYPFGFLEPIEFKRD